MVYKKQIEMSEYTKKVRGVINMLFFEGKKKRFSTNIEMKKEIIDSLKIQYQKVLQFGKGLGIFQNFGSCSGIESNLISCIYHKNQKLSRGVFTLVFKNNGLLNTTEWGKYVTDILKSKLYITYSFSENKEYIILKLFGSEYHRNLIFNV